MTEKPSPHPAAGPFPAPPPWFRDVVWNSLLAASAQLLPTPFVDDLLEGKVRRRMTERLAASYGVVLSRSQADSLAGKRSGWSFGRIAGKAVLYPIKKILRKVIYILAIKTAMDTFSDVFHRGYLLRSALDAGALREASPSDERIEEVAGALEEVLGAMDTRPVGNAVKGVFRNSWRLVRKTMGWLSREGRHGVVQLEETGASREALERESPAAEQLLDRLLLVLWGREDHLRELDRRVASALGSTPSMGEQHADVRQVGGQEERPLPAVDTPAPDQQ